MRAQHPLSIAAGILGATMTIAAAQEPELYAWQAPRVADIDPAATAGMVAELRAEVQKILDAGPLAPLRLAYADIPYEAYWLYYERGRVLTTLAQAYPHVTAAQQAGIREYAHRLFADPRHQPWAPGIKCKTDGARRELSGIGCVEGRYVDPETAPTLHVLYGVWLYGDRSGDWAAIAPHWPDIRQRYADGAARERILYGQMSAHIAAARLARRFGDAATEAAAIENLRRDLADGAEIDAIAARLDRTRYRHFAEPRNRGAFPGQLWVFLDACPEILRFVADHARAGALERAQAMEERYPKWWLHQAPYFTRWTGDEGVGVTPELIGMLHPLARWVRGAPPAELASTMRSAPLGIGDCHWLEALVRTIEAFGTLRWEPVP